MPARKSSSTSTPTSRRAAQAKPTRAAVKKVAAVRPAAAKAASSKSAAAKAAAKPASSKSAAAKPARAKAAPARVAAAKPARVAAPAAARVRPARVAPVAKLTPEDHKRFEVRLLEERARLLKELGYLEANVLKQNPRDSSGDLSGYSFHMADSGTDAMEREKAFLFASSEGRFLHDVDEALRRLYKGEYGACESCNETIAAPRLEVVPHARLCIRCKEREEKAGRR
jgi:RNA polymerase-binding transcription factor DksA